MKQFEKWQEPKDRCGKCKLPKDICGMVNDSLACKVLREDGWRAALELVLSLNSVRVHADVYKDIEKELKGD